MGLDRSTIFQRQAPASCTPCQHTLRVDAVPILTAATLERRCPNCANIQSVCSHEGASDCPQVAK